MTIIPDLPKEHLPLSIQEFIADSPEAEHELWAWVSELHYAQVVAQAGGAHDLVAIKEQFDWTAIQNVCNAYRLYAGKQGVEATHTVQQLCLGVVLKAYYNWSYDTTAQRVRCDNLLVGLSGIVSTRRPSPPLHSGASSPGSSTTIPTCCSSRP